MDLHGAAPVDDHLIGQSSPRIYPVGDAVANLGRAFGWWLVLVTKSWRMIGNGRSRLHALAIFQHRPPANSKPEQPSSCRVSPPSANLEPKNPAAGRGLEWVEKETFFPRITVKTSLTIAGMHALYACLSGLACRRSCTSRTSCEVTSKHASTRVCFSMKQEYYDARYRHRTWCWGITATHQATVAGEKKIWRVKPPAILHGRQVAVIFHGRRHFPSHHHHCTWARHLLCCPTRGSGKPMFDDKGLGQPQRAALADCHWLTTG